MSAEVKAVVLVLDVVEATSVAWIADQKRIGRSVESIRAEIAGAEPKVREMIHRASRELAPLLARIQAAEEVMPFAAAYPPPEDDGLDLTDWDSVVLDAAWRSGRSILNPVSGWWRC